MSRANVPDLSPRRIKVPGERGIYYRQLASGGRRYEITFTDAGTGRQRWKVVDGDLKAARAARGEVLARLHRGETVAKHSTLTVAEVGLAWLEAKTKLRPATLAWYAHARDAYINPRLGRRKIGSIRVDDVARLVTELEARGYAGWTIRGTLTVLGGIMSYAVRRGLAQVNVVRQLERDERPTSRARETTVLDSDEIRSFIDAAPEHYRVLLATAIFTGLRQSELLGLRWEDVDFESAVIHVRHQLDRSRTLAPPKSERSRRDVILMPSLARTLRAHRLASRHSQETDFVFSSSSGSPLYHRNVTRRGFEVARTAVGLDRRNPRLTFHDLRRTFASLLIANGCDVVFVSRQMGHSSVAVTLDVYAKLFDAQRHAQETVSKLEESFAEIFR